MSLWTVFKLLAGLCVLVVMAFTGMLAYHVVVRPLGGVFEKVIPNPADVVGRQPDADFAKMLDSAELPDIDPGEKAFQKAHELLALGQLAEAREKLTAIVNIFPILASAPVARRIVGEMNLDEILSTSHMEGKQVHVVKRGDSFLGIAAKYNTTLDLHHAPQLHDGAQEHPARRRTRRHAAGVPPAHRARSARRSPLWDGGRFIREYPVLHLQRPGQLTPGDTDHRSARNPPSSNGKRGRAPVQRLPRRRKSHPNRQAHPPDPRLGRRPASARRRHRPARPKTWRKSACSPASATKSKSADPAPGSSPSPVLHRAS